jgi:pimeloyl-ACP methyl ester carboxylesterase
MRSDSILDMRARPLEKEEEHPGERAGRKYTGAPETRNAPRPASLATLDVGGVEIPWCATGPLEGEAPVVLFAGIGWRATGCALSGHLSSEIPLLALDYPRRWPRAPLDSMAALAELYSGAIGVLGLGPVRVAGVSMGGMLALWLALERPDLVRSLALVSTTPSGSRIAGRWRMPASRAAAALLPEGSFYRFYRRWGPALVGTAAHATPAEAARLWMDPMSRRKMADLLRAAARFDVSGRLGEIAPPALVVHGGLDRLFTPAAARELAAGLRRSRLALIEGAGHFAFLTHRAAVVRELYRFWKGEEGR